MGTSRRGNPIVRGNAKNLEFTYKIGQHKDHRRHKKGANGRVHKFQRSSGSRLGIFGQVLGFLGSTLENVGGAVGGLAGGLVKVPLDLVHGLLGG